MIIERAMPLAAHIARRFDNRGESIEDLVQVARLDLINAVNRFDADKGAQFVAFAVPTIMGEVRRYFRDHGWSVKVPRRLKELSAQLKKAHEELSQRLGRAPTASEIASHLGIDREEVVQAQVASCGYSTRSSDALLGSDDGDARSVGVGFGSVDADLDKVLDIETVRPLLQALPTREQTVLLLRFFEDMTQTQIAERLGISQMHVSRLLARSLAELRTQVRQPQRV
jgi:RNA polymerase sigma-B factor